MLKASYRVVVAGRDVTSRFAPLAKSITVTKSSKRTAHTAEILLADPDGRVAVPQDGDDISISLGAIGSTPVLVFEGKVDTVTCRYARGAGHEITVSGKSADQKGKIKQPSLRHKDDAKFGDVAQEWGKKADLQVTVVGDLKSIHRDYWIMQNESFQAWGQRMARDLGATFQIVGKRAVFAPRNDDKTSSGKSLARVSVAKGRNLLRSEIEPFRGRPQYKKVEGRYYDPAEAKWKTVKVDVKETSAAAGLAPAMSQATEGAAKSVAGAAAKESEREKGGGTVEILGDPTSEPEAKMDLSGVKDGIDGEYTIDTVTHKADRDGFTTELSVKKPKKGGK